MTIGYKFFSKIVLTISLVFIFSCLKNRKDLNKDVYVCEICPIIKTDEDTLEFANRVMKFVVENSNYGYLPNHLVDTFYNIPFEKFPVDTFFTIFKNFDGVTTCGLSSMLMAKILDYNNIKSFTYNFGLINTEINHVVTLVLSNNKIYIFDPYLNCSYYSVKSKEYLDFLSLVKRIMMDDEPEKVCYDSRSNFIYIDNKTEGDTIKINEKCQSWLSYFEKVDYFMLCLNCGHTTPCYDIRRVFMETYKEFYNKDVCFEYAMLDKINIIYGSSGYEYLNKISDVFFNKLNQKRLKKYD